MALRVRADRVGCSDEGVGCGDGTADIAPVGLSQIGGELKLVGAARKRQPGQGEVAAGTGRRDDLRRISSWYRQAEDLASAESTITIRIGAAAISSGAVETAICGLHKIASGKKAVEAIEKHQSG